MLTRNKRVVFAGAERMNDLGKYFFTNATFAVDKYTQIRIGNLGRNI